MKNSDLTKYWNKRKYFIKKKLILGSKIKRLNENIINKQKILDSMREKYEIENIKIKEDNNLSCVSSQENYSNFIYGNKINKDIELKVSLLKDIVNFKYANLNIDKLACNISKLIYKLDNLKLNKRIYKIKSDKLWFDAILKEKGNIKVRFKDFDKIKGDFKFILETGEIF